MLGVDVNPRDMSLINFWEIGTRKIKYPPKS